VAKKDSDLTGNTPADLANMQRRLELLDHRLDDIDSTVSAVVERVMKQVVIRNITCPRCGKGIEIGIVGNHKIT